MKKKRNPLPLDIFRERNQKISRSINSIDLTITLVLVVLTVLRVLNIINISWLHLSLISIGLGIVQGMLVLKTVPTFLKNTFDGFGRYSPAVLITILITSIILILSYGGHYLICANEFSMMRVYQALALLNGAVFILIKDFVSYVIYDEA